MSLPLLMIQGTWKPGSVTNECVLDELVERTSDDPDAPLDVAAPVTLTGRATENEKVSRFAPGAPDAVPAVAERNVAVTKTRSPGRTVGGA